MIKYFNLFNIAAYFSKKRKNIAVSINLQKFCVSIQLLFFLIREAKQDYQIPDDLLVIKKGQKLIIPIYSMHDDPKYNHDPESLDAKQFSAFSAKGNQNDQTVISFHSAKDHVFIQVC